MLKHFATAICSILTAAPVIAQQIIKEGILSYNQSQTTTYANGRTMNSSGSFAYQFSSSVLRTTSNMRGTMNMITVLDCTSKSAVSYTSDGEEFYELSDEFIPDFPALGKYNTGGIVTSLKDNVKIINGYECKKAVVTSIMDDAKDSIEVWYRPDVRIDAGCFDFIFKNVPGLPVQFSFIEHPTVTIGVSTAKTQVEYKLDTIYTASSSTIKQIENKEKYVLLGEDEKMNKLASLMMKHWNSKKTARPPVAAKGTAVTENMSSVEGLNVSVTRFNPFTIGEKLGPFEAFTIDGKLKNLRSFNGKVVVLNFWFTKCAPCVKEMPMLNNLAKNNKDKAVSFVSMTFNTRQEVQEFLKTNAFDFENVTDAEKILVKYGVSSYPATVVLDKNQVIRYVKIGGMDSESELQKEINKLL